MVNDDQATDRSVGQAPPRGPFSTGALVVVTLGNPRDKFWGMILSLAAEGLSMSGAELASFEDLVLMVKDGDSFTPAVVFFPMHRIERIELDLPDGGLPSLSQPKLAGNRKTRSADSRQMQQSQIHPLLLPQKSPHDIVASLYCSQPTHHAAHGLCSLHRDRTGRRPLFVGITSIRRRRIQ
jgi:hypothetical protein